MGGRVSICFYFEGLFCLFLERNYFAHVEIHRFALAIMTIYGLNIWRLLGIGLFFFSLLMVRDFCFCLSTPFWPSGGY